MSKSNKSFWLSGSGIAALVMIAAVSYFLFMEHREHIFQALPYLIVLLCPLMHVFMHSRHGHHHSEHKHDSQHEKFNEVTKESEAYRDGFIEGLKTGREERKNKEDHDAR